MWEFWVWRSVQKTCINKHQHQIMMFSFSEAFHFIQLLTCFDRFLNVTIYSASFPPLRHNNLPAEAELPGASVVTSETCPVSLVVSYVCRSRYGYYHQGFLASLNTCKMLADAHVADCSLFLALLKIVFKFNSCRTSGRAGCLMVIPSFHNTA